MRRESCFCIAQEPLSSNVGKNDHVGRRDHLPPIPAATLPPSHPSAAPPVLIMCLLRGRESE
jgi:hypothetical protein